MSRPQPRRLSRREAVASAAQTKVPVIAPSVVLPEPTGPPVLADDLLIGAASIAGFIFGSERERRRVYWLIERGALPIFRLGQIICARKSTLVRAVEAREQAATEI
jgi:hypothetical protein